MKKWIASGAALVLVALGLAGCGSDRSADLTEARSFEGYELYFAGQQADGFPLTDVRRWEAQQDGGASDDWSFFYGDCRPAGGEGGCPLPVEIQNYPACRRSATLYVRPLNLFDFRGAKATWRGGATLDVYTGNTTVAIFSRGRAAARRVGRQLRTVNQDNASGQLPPPVRGSLHARPQCPAGGG
ncbi:MAG: hypothetical protein KDB62_07815 [Solirubrobacterales bacterium]|nr:hypothetical protein [Solirubrobacterales bacterium]